MNCCVPPAKMDGVAGVTAIDVRTGVELSTNRFVVEVCVKLPLMPVIVMVYAPVVAVAEAVTVRFVEPAPVTVGGLNTPVTPAGKPLTLKVVVPLNPPKMEVVDVKPVAPPCITLCELGAVLMEKSMALFTIMVTVEL